MILQEIEYEGFRNLIDNHIDFSEDLNIINGENGAGKSNLLESIFFAAYGTSFRTSDDRNLVKFDARYMRITGKSLKNQATVFYNGTKRFMLNGNEKNCLSEYAGWLSVIVMSLNDIWIIRGAPVKRRNFLDWLLIKLNPVYSANLSEYRKIIRQRNCLLQQPDCDRSLMEIYDEQFIHWANVIYEDRRRIIPVMKQKITEKSKELNLSGVSFEYLSSCPDMYLNFDLLRKNAPAENRKGETIIGPHRDDISIMINNHPAKNYASEGECRLLAVILKLAEAEIIQQKIADNPVYLLDEIASVLDKKNKRRVFDLIDGQVFYASVDTLEDLQSSDTRRFCITGGNVALS